MHVRCTFGNNIVWLLRRQTESA